MEEAIIRANAYLDGFKAGLEAGKKEARESAKKSLSFLSPDTKRMFQEEIARGWECELREQRR